MDDILGIVRGWVEKAENDLKTATCVLKMEEECPPDTVCFHAQQCVEKYLKASLVWKSIDFPKTHDIRLLTELLPVSWRPSLSLDETRRLTIYATVSRYPGDYDPISLVEAKEAVKITRRVRTGIRKRLPKQALHLKKR